MIGTEELLISTNFFLEQKFYTAQLQHEQANQFQTPTIVKSPEKQPSKLGILILVLITILLYSLGMINIQGKYSHTCSNDTKYLALLRLAGMR